MIENNLEGSLLTSHATNRNNYQHIWQRSKRKRKRKEEEERWMQEAEKHEEERSGKEDRTGWVWSAVGYKTCRTCIRSRPNNLVIATLPHSRRSLFRIISLVHFLLCHYNKYLPDIPFWNWFVEDYENVPREKMIYDWIFCVVPVSFGK